MSFLFLGLYILGVVLEVILVVLLLRGPFRRYPFLFIYAIAMLATTALEFFILRFRAGDTALFRKVYWTDEVLWFLLLFVTVISLTYLALEDSPLRNPAGKALALVFIGVLALPFLVLHPPFITSPHQWTSAWGAFFNSTSQILNFGGAIMNLVLWTALLTSKKRDGELLTLSAGLGVILSVQAVAFGIRHFMPNQREVPDFLHDFSHVVGMYILCSALWPKPRKSDAPSTPVTNP